MKRKKIVNQRSKKAFRTFIGGLVLLVGLVAIPYPGPGWLIVFAGLAILAQDYPAAQKVLDYAKDKYDSWQDWLKRQNIVVKILVLIATGIVVVLTIYLINGYGLINRWFNLGQDWLNSPLSIFN